MHFVFKSSIQVIADREGTLMILIGIDGNILTGRRQDLFEPIRLSLFRGGEPISAGVEVDGLNFKVVLPAAFSITDGPSLIVKFAGTDIYVPIDPDLAGFINNTNECGFGHIMEYDLFYKVYTLEKPQLLIPQKFIDHVAGGGTQIEYRLLSLATIIDLINFRVVNSAANKILDLGCGCGRMAMGICPVLDPSLGGTYTGFDIWREGISWASENVTSMFPQARFQTLGEHVGYDAKVSYRLDVPDGSQDGMLATSVFTHLRFDPANHYASEIARVLKEGGKAYVTFFASKEVYRSWKMPQDPEEDDYGIHTVNVQAEDTFTDEAKVRQMFESHGLKVLGAKYGNWRGGTQPHRGVAGGQDVFILKKL